MEVDGPNNSVQELNVYAAEPDKNPYKQSFFSTTTTFNTERDAMRNVYPYSGRYWRIVNPNRRNRNGETCGWKLSSGNVSFPLQYPESILMKRAGYLKHNIWVTPYHPRLVNVNELK
jgi:primary-amine oxidase